MARLPSKLSIIAILGFICISSVIFVNPNYNQSESHVISLEELFDRSDISKENGEKIDLNGIQGSIRPENGDTIDIDDVFDGDDDEDTEEDNDYETSKISENEEMDFDDEELFDLEDLEDIFPEDDPEAARLFKDVEVADVDADVMTTPSSVHTTEEPASDDDKQRMNVLMIMTDDMRPQLEAYQGEDFPAPYMHRKMFTPNLDRLSESSLLLKRAYVQYSLCGPSRTSMLTSRRPDTTRIFGNNNYWRDTGGDFTTLPQYFKERGYTTKGFGKIFHRGKSSKNNDKKSWTEPYYMPVYTDNYHMPKGESGAGWKAISSKERQKVPLSDEYSVAEVKKDLTNIAKSVTKGKDNFFYALGFKKPHLSLICPEEYFHLYPLEQEEFYMPEKGWQSPDVKSTVGMGEAEGGAADHLKVIPDEVIRHLRRAYFACISFVDSLIGKVLVHLERVGLANNTIVVFVADHGYHLGENNHWGKVTNYERATHVPMMIRVPGRTDAGVTTRALVEAVDLYPTVVEAAGLGRIKPCPLDSSDIQTCTEGRSMLHLVENPEHRHKKVVYSQIASGGQFMSYTIRTDRYRLIDWAEVKKKPRSDGLYDVSMDWELTGWPWWTALYDRKIDPEERFNRTGDPQYRRVETKLRDKLHSFVDKFYEHPKFLVTSH